MAVDRANLSGSRVLVTGASRGYGAAVARALALHGARLLLTATEPVHLARVMRDCRGAGADCTAIVLDLADPASIDRAVEEVGATVPRLEGVVMNAGILGPMGPLDQADPDGIAHALAITLTGPVRVMQRLSPLIADRAGVVLVTSGAAARPGYGAYGLGKAGLEALGFMLRGEWAHRGIRVVAVNPGPVRTDMRAEAHPGEDPATVPPPSERVAPVLAVLAGDDPGPRVQAAQWGLS